nr:hypothetical protein [Tanacetum cinerariifolium]
MDVEEPILDDVVNDADQPQDDADPKNDKSTGFKQPPRPETPDPEWNKDPNILSVIGKKVDKQFGYGYLEEIVVRRADQKEYTFKEGDLSRLHLNDIEDMLPLHVQNKIFNLPDDDIVNLVIALRMFTQSIVIKKKVKDVQLGVESYQKKLNITKPQTTFDGILFK